MYTYFKKIGSADHISACKSKGLSDESIKPPSTSDDNLAPSLDYIGTKKRVKIVESCLKQVKITFTQKKIVKIYLVYKMNMWDRGYDDYATLENSLFGAVRLVKMMILISTNILDMELDLIDVKLFQ